MRMCARVCVYMSVCVYVCLVQVPLRLTLATPFAFCYVLHLHSIV